jgi:hypothetical protein
VKSEAWAVGSARGGHGFCVVEFRSADGVAKPVVRCAGNTRRSDLKIGCWEL